MSAHTRFASPTRAATPSLGAVMVNFRPNRSARLAAAYHRSMQDNAGSVPGTRVLHRHLANLSFSCTRRFSWDDLYSGVMPTLRTDLRVRLTVAYGVMLTGKEPHVQLPDNAQVFYTQLRYRHHVVTYWALRTFVWVIRLPEADRVAAGTPPTPPCDADDIAQPLAATSFPIRRLARLGCCSEALALVCGPAG